MHRRLALLALLLVGGPLLVGSLLGVTRRERRLTNPSPTVPSSVQETPPDATLSVAPHSGRVPTTDEPLRAAGERPPASEGEKPSGSLRLKFLAEVVDEQDVPLAGAGLYTPFSLGHQLLARSDAGGRIEAELLLPEDWASRQALFAGDRVELEFLARGRIAHREQVLVVAGAEVRLGRITLATGGEIAGSVSDAAGAPIVGAHVAWIPGAEEGSLDEGDLPVSSPSNRTRSDAMGNYRIAVRPGSGILYAERDGLAGHSGVLTIDGGGERTIDLILAADPRRVPILVERPDGTPQPGARVHVSREGLEAFFFRRGRTDERGIWTLRFHDSSAQRVYASVPDASFAPTPRVTVRPGDGQLRLRLCEQRWLQVALVDPAGAEIPWGHVRGTAPGDPIPLTPTDDHGRARIPLPREPFELDVMAPGFRRASLGPFEPAVVGEELELPLEPGSFVRGRVRSPSGAVRGARIRVQRSFARRTTSINVAPLDRPFLIVAAVALDGQDATTDADGRFLATLHTDAPVFVRVTAPGFPSTVFGPFPPDDRGSVRDLDLLLVPGGTLKGRVRTAPGRPSKEDVLVAVSDGWGFAFTRPVDERGAYRFDDLAPGDWQVRPVRPPAGTVERLFSRPGGVAEEPPWDVRVRSGEVTTFDLDLGEFERCLLIGRLETDHPSDWTVRLRSDDGILLAEADLDDSGGFELRTSWAGSGRLDLSGGGPSITAVLPLAPGLQTWTYAVRRGTLRVRGTQGLDDAARARLCFRVRDGAITAEGWPRKRSPQPDGSIELLVPAGAGELGYRDGRGAWTSLLRVTVPAGEAVETELP